MPLSLSARWGRLGPAQHKNMGTSEQWALSLDGSSRGLLPLLAVQFWTNLTVRDVNKMIASMAIPGHLWAIVRHLWQFWTNCGPIGGPSCRQKQQVQDPTETSMCWERVLAGRGCANTAQQEDQGHTKIYEKHCADSVLSRGVWGVAACPPCPQMQHKADFNGDKFVNQALLGCRL